MILFYHLSLQPKLPHIWIIRYCKFQLKQPQFKLSKSPSVLYRKSTHELFTEIEKDGKKQMVDRTIVLGGKRGVGKSTLLYTAVNHFLQNDWIVFYEPQLSQWTSGIYPYASVKDSTLYDQPNLAASILKSFSELNKTQLVKIQSAKNGNLYELAQSGVKNLLKSHSILESVMEELIASEKRPPILFALDQVNALYTQTHYFDKESQPLTANRLRVVNQIHKLLDSKSLKNLSTVIAQSESHSLIRSKFLIGQIEKAKLISETDPFDLSFDRFEALENDVEGNVSLPLKLNPLQMDPFLNSIDVSVRELHHFKVPMLTTEEAKTMIFFYKTTNALHQDPVDQPYVTKQWMLSQGNALELFRAATFI
ncbi:mitochondrial ribosomal death-associated protein 3-domain-containing protein [Globomyces pollinis-pini]|nr:mitochondrial ribosomal death-associated protein 3-domain-containing protein [Globomyces pollinis-pini]